jgi:hypothetical protein
MEECLMNAAVSSFTERRDETRVTGHSEARMEAPKAVFAQEGAVVLEEVSGCGLRLRSDVQLHPDEELVIHLKHDPLPIHATVIWVQEFPHSLFGKRRSWISGCRLDPDSMARVRLEPEAQNGLSMGFGRKAMWAGVLFGAAAAVTYLLLRFASWMGAAGGLH